MGSQEETIEGCRLSHKELKLENITLHYVECGNPNNQLVLLLHGFPSFWYTWKHQLGPLSNAGYHVVAPDLRGYNLSEKPKEVHEYSRASLTQDVDGFVNLLNNGKPAIIVGHDWGGMVAWAYTQDYPQKVARLAVLNMPHPKVFQKTLWSSPRQMRRSWYMFLFQVPKLGETLVSANGFQNLVSIINTGVTNPSGNEHNQRHIDAFSIPGALTSSINYYKAMFRSHWSKPPNSSDVVKVPVSIIWGENDIAFIPELANPPLDLLPNCSMLKIPLASHWVMWDEPAIVNKRLIKFFTGELDSNGTQSKL